MSGYIGHMHRPEFGQQPPCKGYGNVGRSQAAQFQPNGWNNHTGFRTGLQEPSPDSISNHALSQLIYSDVESETVEPESEGLTSAWDSSTVNNLEEHGSEREDGELDDTVIEELDALMANPPTLDPRTKRAVEEIEMPVEKFVLVDVRKRFFEVLPEGWNRVLHESGMPLYYHEASGSCTLSRPYQQRADSLRSHRIPVSSVPCLEYVKAKKRNALTGCPSNQISGQHPAQPLVEVVSANEYMEQSLLTPQDFHAYCAKVFDFKLQKIRKTGETRNEADSQSTSRTTAKRLRSNHGPAEAAAMRTKKAPGTFMKSGIFVTFHRFHDDGTPRKPFEINIANKSVLSILHDFLHATRKTIPTYEFGRSTSRAHAAKVFIEGQLEAEAEGATKKAAKTAAAEILLVKLAPELRSHLESRKNTTLDKTTKDLELFHDIAVEDPRISDMTYKSGTVNPVKLLRRALQCLDKEAAMDKDATHIRPQTVISMSQKKVTEVENEYTMTAGRFWATLCWREPIFARAMCAQKILKQLNPELLFYGEFIQLYAVDQDRQKADEDGKQREIIDLQYARVHAQPNWALLAKLKEEMAKLIPYYPAPGQPSAIRY